MNRYIERLSLLRAAMDDKNIDFYVIPSADPHLGEYVPDHWRIINWLTGFTGSSATVVITSSFAGLWTDSRYFIQAEKQLYGSGFRLINPDLQESGNLIDWIAREINTGNKVALDGSIFSIEWTRKIEKMLNVKNISFDFECDLISQLWTDRPPMPFSEAFDHPIQFCGKDRSDKIEEVRERMRLTGVDFQFLTSIDDIMWLLNIRGHDIKFSPLIISFAIIGKEQILLFLDENKIPLKLASEFDRLGIVMLPYEETSAILSTLSPGSTMLINPSTTSSSLFKSIPGGMKVIEDISIPSRLKAVKNAVEIGSIRKAMVRDGVALSRFFFWLEQESDPETRTELSIGEMLENLRSENENYLGPSFSSIVALNEHGALPHYTSTAETDINIGTEGILLIDSGGQYLDGTTDITRTISLGIPTGEQRRDFSLVLRGTINLALAKFPVGTKGFQLDVLARKALWENGFNYGHGTGHGVGFCLNVHEGPQNIGPGSGTGSKTIIEPGMLISDEPAIYREGKYGIRIENLILCSEERETEFGNFLKFDTVSLCYIDKSLIDISLLDRKEIDWLNFYHTEVYNKLSPFLSDAEKIWLREKTEAI